MKKFFPVLLFVSFAACSPVQPSLPPAFPQPFPSLALPAKWTETLTPTITYTPTATLTETPERLPNGMDAHPPSEAELNNIKSLWSLVTYRELMTPGMESYTVVIAPNSAWIWDWRFCAVKGNFSDFITAIDMEFQIDVHLLHEGTHLRIFDGSNSGGWVCREWSTVLSNWPVNEAVDLTVRYSSTIEVDDGLNDYPAGEYIQRLTVIAEH